MGAQDPGWLSYWKALAELHRERAGSRDHQEWPTGHSLWDPRGRGLQLHRERPGKQECVRDEGFYVRAWLSIPSTVILGSWDVFPDIPGLTGLLMPSSPWLLGVRRQLSI